MKAIAKALTYIIVILGMIQCTVQMYHESTTRQSTFVYIMFSLMFMLLMLLLYVMREEDKKDNLNS